MKIKVFLILLLLTCPKMWSQDTQLDTRVNPDIDTVGLSASTIVYPKYINLSANHIKMNGADWGKLSEALKNARSQRVNIVHIGDSHEQADMGTSVVRRRLGSDYGSAGRGLTVPFKLAGSNQPTDYSITSSSPMKQSRLMKTPWPTPMGFTGIGVQPTDSAFSFNLEASQPFDSVTVYFTGKMLIDSLEIENSYGLRLPSSTLSTTLNFRGIDQPTIHGFNLLSDSIGLAYHVIGNNGTTYSTYSELPNFIDGLAALDPQLIILSSGTNEAFNRLSEQKMLLSLQTLIADLRRRFPEAQLLLTTPSESQRKTTRRRGRKRRRRVSYQVNTNVKRMRDVIVNFGETEGIPVYDFYEVAGGAGSSSKWLKDKYLNKDHIHLTLAGYRLQGNLFADALEEVFNSVSQKTTDL